MRGRLRRSGGSGHGSEGQGLRPDPQKCDFLISIPRRGQVASLNVSVATGVILYEILGKWGKGS
jgi:23S rRNA (guanosine2251-2'-O)-methyltransferase